MSVNTSNIYGKITISDEAVATVASHAASECYGVVELVSRKLTDNISRLFNKQNPGQGIRVLTEDNMIFIDIFVVLKLGVSVEAVTESLKSTVKYSVESFTGMRVKNVNVNVVGLRV